MIFRPLLFCLMLTSPAAPSLAQSTTKSPSKRTHGPVAPTEYGVASYYAKKFEGRKTASGEAYNSKKMTAAHNHLPFGTWIRVTNTRNGRSVVVKVNDRLHRNNTRIVDLSYAAAAKLGYITRGLTRVKVEVLGKKKPAEKDLSGL